MIFCCLLSVNPAVRAADSVDVSGTYRAEINASRRLVKLLLTEPKLKDEIRVVLVQDGTSIEGTYENGKGKIWGDIQGDVILFEWYSGQNWSGKGKWKVKPGGKEIVGTYYRTMGISQDEGELNLIRIE